MPHWLDRCDILAALRASDYDVKSCIGNMHLIGYDSAPNYGDSRRLMAEKDKHISMLELQLKEAVCTCT